MCQLVARTPGYSLVGKSKVPTRLGEVRYPPRPRSLPYCRSVGRLFRRTLATSLTRDAGTGGRLFGPFSYGPCWQTPVAGRSERVTFGHRSGFWHVCHVRCSRTLFHPMRSPLTDLRGSWGTLTRENSSWLLEIDGVPVLPFFFSGKTVLTRNQDSVVRQ